MSKKKIKKNKKNTLKPDKFKEVDQEDWPCIAPWIVKIWKSDKFLVQLVRDDHDALRLTINRTDFFLKRDGTKVWKEGISWNELQRIKSEVGYGDSWACEIYPTDDRVVNKANMRHLWLCEEPQCAW